MPIGNIGYDYMCKNGYKIDVKSSCIRKYGHSFNSYWSFMIYKNEVADYFLMISFDSREELNLMYIWLFKGIELIRGRKLNERTGFSIPNTEKGLKMYEKYEITDKLNEIREICRFFKENDKK